MEFGPNRVDLFVRSGRLINASGAGQTEIDEAIRKSLARIDRDEEGVASRLFPFVRGTEGEPKVIFQSDPSSRSGSQSSSRRASQSASWLAAGGGN